MPETIAESVLDDDRTLSRGEAPVPPGPEVRS
jgi:hypothetical protein